MLLAWPVGEAREWRKRPATEELGKSEPAATEPPRKSFQDNELLMGATVQGKTSGEESISLRSYKHAL